MSELLFFQITTGLFFGSTFLFARFWKWAERDLKQSITITLRVCENFDDLMALHKEYLASKTTPEGK